MNPIFVGIIGSAIMFILLAIGVPIAFTLMLVGFAGVSYLTSFHAALPMVASTVYETASYYPYSLIPLFIIMGGLAGSSGLTRELYSTFNKWFGRMPGGLAIATIVAAACFSAISGSSVACAAAMGTVAIPEMKRYGYSPSLSTGSVVAGATLDFLIPPSLGFVIYGMLTEQSIGKLLIAGIFPGLILAGAYIIIIVTWVMMNPKIAPKNREQVSMRERIASLKGIYEPLLLFILVIGGIYVGFFTPNEAGAIGAAAMFAIALAKKRLSMRALFEALKDAAKISAMVLFLVAGANVFSYFLALTTIPMRVAMWTAGLHVSPYVILWIIILIYILLGSFLDAVSMMILTMPVFYPVIQNLHFDPIWFGVIAVIMMEAGLIHPPIGLCVYTVAGVAKDIPVGTIFWGALPFIIAIMFLVVLITIFPGIATFLPTMMLG